jgi:hypothetical protein
VIANAMGDEKEKKIITLELKQKCQDNSKRERIMF